MIKPVSILTILDDPAAAMLLHEYSIECSYPELGYGYPQRELYAAMEQSGGFQAFGVYDEDTLVGFASLVMYPLPHYGHKIAVTESIFVSFTHRGKGIGLLEYLENHAKQCACLILLYTAPMGSRFDKLLGSRKDCRHSNNVYLRNLQ